MTALDPLATEPLVSALGWSLLHFLWQGAVVAVLVAAARAGLRNASAQARYLAGCASLLLLALLPAATFGWLRSVPPQVPTPAASHEDLAAPTTAASAHMPSDAAAPALAGAVDLQPWRQRAETLLRPALPWLVAGWLAGVLLLSLRLVGGWSVALRLRRRAWPVGPDLLQTLARLQERLRVSRPVLLLHSAAVAVPTVVGMLRPAILLPLSALCGLSPAQLETILAHELAHVRRHDFLVNLLQSLVETLLFYHPAVWWVSSWVRIEREHCCDDVAVAACGDALCYAQALTDLEAWRGSLRPLAVAADGGVLLGRIRRLLGVPAPDAVPSAWPMAGLILLLLSAGGTGALVLRPAAVAHAQPAAQAAVWPAEAWYHVRDGGRALEVARDRRVLVVGFGKLHIDTKKRLLELAPGQSLTLGGRPVSDVCVPRDTDVLESRAADGARFWRIQLEAPTSGPPPDPRPEPSVLGSMSLELDNPTALSLQFVAPHGVAFSSRPAQPRTLLGLLMDDLPADLSASLGIAPADAQLVTALPDGLPAAAAGLKPGDVIVALDGRRPVSWAHIVTELARRQPGDVLTVSILRDGRPLALPVTLGSQDVYGQTLDAFQRQHDQPEP
jgi:beta-lactamase regulating signal transducer with metallopeptidase domain